MNIKVKTEFIEVDVTDEVVFKEGYTKHELPDLEAAIKTTIEETIKAHFEIKNKSKITKINP